mmetsp:Transcript_24476/g.43970  ORF Transcript_24476/g.43970 Transcript_24476/m.43970 type:complete len:201 (-) Transcript_24476:94-696(-)
MKNSNGEKRTSHNRIGTNIGLSNISTTATAAIPTATRQRSLSLEKEGIQLEVKGKGGREASKNGSSASSLASVSNGKREKKETTLTTAALPPMPLSHSLLVLKEPKGLSLNSLRDDVSSVASSSTSSTRKTYSKKTVNRGSRTIGRSLSIDSNGTASKCLANSDNSIRNKDVKLSSTSTSSTASSAHSKSKKDTRRGCKN